MKKEQKLNKLIAQNLRLFRKKFGLSQSNVAHILDISFQQVQKYEKGINRITAAKLFILSNKFKFDINDFFKSNKTNYLFL